MNKNQSFVVSAHKSMHKGIKAGLMVGGLILLVGGIKRGNLQEELTGVVMAGPLGLTLISSKRK